MPFAKKNKGCVLNCEEFIATENGFVEVDFYDFPSDPKIRSIWIDRVRKEKKLKAWNPTKKSKLCGMHFNNSGKNIHNEIIPRYFGETIYTPAGFTEPRRENVIVPEVDDVKIKEEIDLDEEHLDEAICIADYSNIYNTVPVTNNVPTTITFNPSNFEVAKIKEENMEFESEEPTFFENNIFEIEEHLEVTDKTTPINGYITQKNFINHQNEDIRVNGDLDKTTPVNGYTTQKDFTNHQNEDIRINKSYPDPPTLWKWDDPSLEKREKETTKESHTHPDDCDRDLHRLTKQMKELEENLSNAHRRIAEGQISVINLSKKVTESNKVKQQLEEENKQLKTFLVTTAIKSPPKKEGTHIVELREEIARRDAELALLREKVKSLDERWHRKFESFNSDEEVRFYTGFQSTTDFKKFCDMAVEMDPLFDASSCDNVLIRKEIMITLMRLRLGLQLQDLAFRYDLPLEKVQQCVSHWQGVLSESSFNRKICPSGVVIVKFFVVKFRYGFKFRYFLGVSPHGYVIYVSDLFPLAADEINIVQASEIQSLIEEGFTVKSLDTDRFSDLGISYWSASPEEQSQFNIVLSKLVQEVQENGVFKNILPSDLVFINDVSKTWKVCCYLQNYIEF